MNDAPSSIGFLVNILVIMIVVCMALALLAIPIVVFVVHRRKKMAAAKQLTQLAASFGSRTHVSFFSNTYTMQGLYHDVPYEMTYHGGSVSRTATSSSSITIAVPVRPSFTLSLRKENWDTKVSKKTGMATELEIGVPEFDDEFFLRTNDPTSCRSFLLVAKHRAAIRQIHQQGYTLAFTRKGIELRKAATALWFADREIIDESETRAVLEAVVVLAKGL